MVFQTSQSAVFFLKTYSNISQTSKFFYRSFKTSLFILVAFSWKSFWTQTDMIIPTNFSFFCYGNIFHFWKLFFHAKLFWFHIILLSFDCYRNIFPCFSENLFCLKAVSKFQQILSFLGSQNIFSFLKTFFTFKQYQYFNRFWKIFGVQNNFFSENLFCVKVMPIF